MVIHEADIAMLVVRYAKRRKLRTRPFMRIADSNVTKLYEMPDMNVVPVSERLTAYRISLGSAWDSDIRG